jgi:hypothetical protein
MGFIGKVTRAVTLWTNADFRRAEVLAETIFYGIGMATIGRAFFRALPWTAAAPLICCCSNRAGMPITHT